MKKVRWGILGTAEIAEEQMIPAMQKSINSELAAIASRSPSGNAEMFAEKFNIPQVYHSYGDLLKDPAIDAVYVPLPNHLHAKWTKIAANYGKHVLCEKPAALTVDEVKEMADVCEENDVIFMEAMMYQFHPQHQRVKEMIQEGLIGEIKQMRTSFTFKLERLGENFRLKPQKAGGGSIYDIGCYCIHAIRSILGEPAQVLYANETFTADGRADNAAIGIFGHENGIKSYFDCGMNMATRNEYEIIGTKGTVRVPKAFIPQKDGEGMIQIIAGDGSITEETVVADYYAEGMTYFSQSILDKTKLHRRTEDTINNMQAIGQIITYKDQSRTIC
jgi:predicted dehydrogenase